MQQYYPTNQTDQPVAQQPEEEAPKVEDVKSSPDTKDTEAVAKKPEEEENEANGLDFDEME